MSKVPVSLFMGLACVLSLVVEADAATITVGKGDIQTIQDAVNTAEDFDTIVIPKGEYVVPTDIDLSGFQGLTIKGKGRPVLSASGGENVFYAENAEGLVFTGLAFTGGVTAIALYTSDDCEIVKCAFGGITTNAVYSEENTDLVVEKCTFEDIDGDGVYDAQSEGTAVLKCSFSGVNGIAITLGENSQLTNEGIAEKNKIENCEYAIVFAGDQSRVIRNVIGTVTEYAIFSAGTPQASGSVIEKNKISNDSGSGMFIAIVESTVSKNNILLQGGGCYAIWIQGTDNVVEKNKILRSACYGIRTNGTGHQFLKNAITNCGSAGFYVFATDSSFIGNKVTNNQGFGFEFSSGDNEVTGNKVTGTDGTGIYVDADGISFTGNKVLKSSGDGFFLLSGTQDNVLDKNTVKKNNTSGSGDTFDIHDDAVDGENDIQDTNKYGTISDPVQDV